MRSNGSESALVLYPRALAVAMRGSVVLLKQLQQTAEVVHASHQDYRHAVGNVQHVTPELPELVERRDLHSSFDTSLPVRRR